MQDPMVKTELASLDQKQRDIQVYAAKNALCMGDDTPWSYVFKQRLEADDLDSKIVSDFDDSLDEFANDSSGGGDFGQTEPQGSSPSTPSAPSAPQGGATSPPQSPSTSGASSPPTSPSMPGMP